MIRQEDLQELMTYEAVDSQVISLYLDVDTSRETSETIKKEARSLFKENTVPVADAAAIESYLDLSYDWDKPGLAVFSCASDNFFRAFPSAVAFRNRVRIGTKPHVKPLIHLLDHYSHYGVIVVDRIGARFFEYHLGELQDTAGSMGDDVRKQKTGGGSARSGGASSATGQRGGQGDRNEQEVALRNLRDSAAASQQFFASKPIRRLFLGGTAENVAQFRELLSKQLQSRIAGTFAVDMTAGEHEVRAISLELLETANAEREQKLVKRMITAAAKGGNAVVGLSATLQTVSEGRVQILVISDGYRKPGYIDEGGNYLLVQQNDGNSFGVERFVEVEDVVEAAVSRTMEQGGNVEIISDSRELEKAGSIGALLRY
jgi:peptide subunit release factor 1 (eRF1)